MKAGIDATPGHRRAFPFNAEPSKIQQQTLMSEDFA
jgi:hypothetical protein